MKENPSSSEKENNNNEKNESLLSSNLSFSEEKSCPISSKYSSVSTLASLALTTTSPAMATSPRVSR